MVLSLVQTVAYASEVESGSGGGAPVVVTTLDKSVDASSICVSLNILFRNKETGEEELLEDIDTITPENVTVGTFETVKTKAIEDAKTKLNEWLEKMREKNPDVQFTVVGDMDVKGDAVPFDNRVYTMRSGEPGSGTTSRYMEITGDYGKRGSYSVTMTVEAVGDIPSYSIIDGANGEWTLNSGKTLAFRADGDFSKFIGVKVDNALIDAKNYTAVSGSTIVTLNAEYLNTLSVGPHTLTIVYNDLGKCTTNFVIKAANSNTPAKPNVGNTTPVKSPQTGDNSMMWLWFVLLCISSAGAVGTTIYSRKKKYSAK